MPLQQFKISSRAAKRDDDDDNFFINDVAPSKAKKKAKKPQHTRPKYIKEAFAKVCCYSSWRYNAIPTYLTYNVVKDYFFWCYFYVKFVFIMISVLSFICDNYYESCDIWDTTFTPNNWLVYK